MSSEHGTQPSAAPDDTASRFDRAGESAYNLALRITGSPGAAWHATAAAFAAVAGRIPAGAPPQLADQDLLLMGCWHARSILGQLAASPEYAAQLHQHDQAARAATPLQAAVVGANDALPVDGREVLALRGLSDLDHAELSGLLRVDPGLLATMLAQSRLMLSDALRGEALAATATEDPEDRHALALAALRQDGQLRGAEGRERLSAWLGSSDRHQTVVDALEEAGIAYRAWAPEPVPAGLREAVIAASASVVPPPDQAAPVAAAPAAETPHAGATGVPAPRAGGPGPSAGGPAASIPTPAAPRGAGAAPPVDPGATVEWSSRDVAALGLEGANVAPAPPPGPAAPGRDGVESVDESDSGEDWDDAWDSGEASGELLQPVDHHGRAPRWQIALVAILLVAVIVALVVALTGSDEPTQESPAPAGTSTERTTRTTSALPASVVGAIHLPGGTVRIVTG